VNRRQAFVEGERRCERDDGKTGTCEDGIGDGERDRLDRARKQEGVLQHGSLPLIGDLTRICQALVFKDEATRENAAQRLLMRATTVESVIGLETAWETAAQAFVHGFEAQLGICFERGEMSRSESERAEELVREKYGHPSWTERS
jgi:lipoate-protein ligase A